MRLYRCRALVLSSASNSSSRVGGGITNCTSAVLVTLPGDVVFGVLVPGDVELGAAVPEVADHGAALPGVAVPRVVELGSLVLGRLVPGTLELGDGVLSDPNFGARAAILEYTGYSTVKELLVGCSLGASQFQRVSSLKTTSRETCMHFETGSYL